MAGNARRDRGHRLVLGALIAVASGAVLPSELPAEPWNWPQMDAVQSGHFQFEQPNVKSHATLCGDNERWSPKASACVCARGLHREGETCVGESPVTAAAEPVESEPQATTPESTDQDSPRVQATKRAQRCFAELGLYNGPIDGKGNRDTWTAYWYFKHANGLTAYRDYIAEPVQQKVSALCKGGEETAIVAPAAAPTPPADGQAEREEERPSLPLAEDQAVAPGRTSLDIDCLPENLLSVLRRTQGRAVTAKACEPVCLPAPKGLNQADLAVLEARSGFAWCRDCVPIEGRLALKDVQRIERAGNIQLCATPPKQLPRHLGGADVSEKAYTRVRELYRSLPPAAEDAAAIAVVIGNRNYAALPASETSRNDADAIYSLLTEHLGYAQDNVVLLQDARKADLDKMFGTVAGAEGELAHLVGTHPGANVLVYYSGLGATNVAQNETYLLPVDTERYREERNGYPLSSLYAGLSKLGAKSVLVLLEAEFGRDQSAYVLPPNVPETTRTVLPEAPLAGVTVLAAADRGQRTLIDLNYSIGLFTRYLIEGLAGNADLPPIGNGDGKLDSAETYVFTAEMVQLAARKTYGLLQNPVYSSAATAVISARGPGALAGKQ